MQTPEPVTLTPRPAQVDPGFPGMRRYGATMQAAMQGVLSSCVGYYVGTSITRPADRDVAEASMLIGYGPAQITVQVRYTADDLEALAQMFLDAAHDLRAHPAASLVQGGVA